jgi:glycosyltransferase involved in cell wall biosynthesis
MGELVVSRKPLVSIIITTHNRSKLLQRAIKSALGQSYENIEIIIVDDASSDDTERIVLKYIKNDTRIQYIKNEKQSGANVSRNKGILASSGKFIAGLDDDDEFLPDRINLLIKNYDSSYAFITSLNIIQFDKHKSYSKAPEIVTIEHMKKDNILMNQAFIEKKRLISVGLYDEKLTAYQDYDMWIRLMQKFGTVKVLQEYTQKVYFESFRDRISTLPQKRFKGYFNFYTKHKRIFSTRERKNFLATFYAIRNKKITLKNYTAIKTKENESKISKLINDSNLHYYIVQNFYEKLNQIDKTKHYILYGYGSIGRIVLAQLHPNILAIIDSGIKEGTRIKNIPVINISKARQYGSDVILTPVPYKDEIINSLDSKLNIIDVFNTL